MPYRSLDIPTGTHPDLERIVRDQVDPRLREVHAMLRLPISDVPGLEPKCHFSATLVLLSVVAGVAATLYDDPTLARLDPRVRSGEAFRRVLTHHYPWNEEPVVEGAIHSLHAAAVLYDAFRCPLTHCLGMLQPDEDHGHGQRRVAKGAMSDEKIEAMEQARTRPTAWTGSTLSTDGQTKADRTKTVLNVKLFYWGVRRMIWNVLAARQHNVTSTRGEILSIPATITTPNDSYLDGGSPQ